MVSLEADELGEQVVGTDVWASSSETMCKQQTDWGQSQNVWHGNKFSFYCASVEVLVSGIEQNGQQDMKRKWQILRTVLKM